MQKEIPLLLLLLLLCSCSLNTSTVLSSDQLTIEGHISEDKFAEVFLTNSLAFTGVIDSLQVATSIESKAKVTIFDGETSEILTLKKDDSRFPFLFYRSNIIKGDVTKNYKLSVSIRGKTFTSKTTIPKQINILEVNFLKSIEEGVNQPNFRNIELTIENNTTNIRYFKVLAKTKEENKFKPAKPFIFNTENIFTNTFPLVITYVEFNDGVKTNKLVVNENIELRIVAITKDQFGFWKSVKGDESTLVENTSFTNEVKTNISNGAFGYWSGENTKTLKFKILEN